MLNTGKYQLEKLEFGDSDYQNPYTIRNRYKCDWDIFKPNNYFEKYAYYWIVYHKRSVDNYNIFSSYRLELVKYYINFFSVSQSRVVDKNDICVITPAREFNPDITIKSRDIREPGYYWITSRIQSPWDEYLDSTCIVYMSISNKLYSSYGFLEYADTRSIINYQHLDVPRIPKIHNTLHV